MIRRTATLLLIASVMAIPATTLAQNEQRGRNDSNPRGQQERSQRGNTGTEQTRSTRADEVRRDPAQQPASQPMSTRTEQVQRDQPRSSSQPSVYQPRRGEWSGNTPSRVDQSQTRQPDQSQTRQPIQQQTRQTDQPQARPSESTRRTTGDRSTRYDGNVSQSRGESRSSEPSSWQGRSTDSRWNDRGERGDRGYRGDRNDRGGIRYNRYEGRYDGRWDSRTYEDRFKRYGYGRAKYVYYHEHRIYRAPYYSGVIRVRPPYYRGMPRIIYPDYRAERQVVLYRPIWAPDYVFVRRFVFFPRLNLYWDNYSNAFVYLRGSRWISSVRLPGIYVNINLGTEPVFEVEEDYDSEDGYYDDGSYYYEY